MKRYNGEHHTVLITMLKVLGSLHDLSAICVNSLQPGSTSLTLIVGSPVCGREGQRASVTLFSAARCAIQYP